MQRIDMERSAIERARRETRSMNAAARSLHVSRRTLQNRMREIGMERAHAGRPRTEIKYHGGGKLGGAIVLVAAALGIGYLVTRKSSTVAGEQLKSVDLRGLDIICQR